MRSKSRLPLAVAGACCLLAAPARAQGPAWMPQASGVAERLRAVSAVSAKVAWASGNKGTVLRTVDGGTTWERLTIPEAGDLDFRDIEAFGERTAYALSIGSGGASRVYKTGDGGTTWTLQLANPEPRGFYDSIAFWDEQNGMVMGDPVDDHYTLLRTDDGGAMWLPVAVTGLPEALPDESAFAASGTCIVTGGRGNAWFVTGGGPKSRVFRTADGGSTWTVADTPMIAGASSAGIFSVAFADPSHGIVVGGDYKRVEEANANVAVTRDGGATWAPAKGGQLRAFRSGVGYLPGTRGKVLVVVGPAGSDYSTDGGGTWKPLGNEGYHALSIAPDGTVWAVGEQGRIGRLAGRLQ